MLLDLFWSVFPEKTLLRNPRLGKLVRLGQGSLELLGLRRGDPRDTACKRGFARWAKSAAMDTLAVAGRRCAGSALLQLLQVLQVYARRAIPVSGTRFHNMII